MFLSMYSGRGKKTGKERGKIGPPFPFYSLSTQNDRGRTLAVLVYNGFQINPKQGDHIRVY